MTAIRTEPFVPLTSGPAANRDQQEFRVTVLPQSAQARPFRAIENQGGLPVGANPIVRPGCEPIISVQRDADRITSIRVQCSCGQVIDLACLYDGKS